MVLFGRCSARGWVAEGYALASALAVFAAYPVAVSVEIIDIRAYDSDRPAHICGAVALSRGTIDITRYRNTGPRVVWVAGFLGMSAADEGCHTETYRAKTPKKHLFPPRLHISQLWVGASIICFQPNKNGRRRNGRLPDSAPPGGDQVRSLWVRKCTH